MNTTSLNSRERKAQRLLAHYSTCERLARYLQHPDKAKCDHFFALPMSTGRKTCLKCGGVFSPVDGKKISVALFKAERQAHQAVERYCNGEISEEQYWTAQTQAEYDVTRCLMKSGKLPPGFFVNSDPRGAALKIDNENAEGRALIEAVGLQRDMGGFGLLSPEINGDR